MSDNTTNATTGTAQVQNFNPLSSWASFYAVMTIIFGSILCLGIIYAIFGVPIIIAGVKLFGSVKSFKQLSETGDVNNYNSAIEDMNTYFIINGILIIIALALIVIGIFALIALLSAGAFTGLKDNLRL
jgi:hypothetical protein